MVAVSDAALADTLSASGGGPELVDDTAVIPILTPSQTVILPGKRLAAALRVLPGPPATKLTVPTYRVPLALDAAAVLLSDKEKAELNRQVAAGVIALAAP